LNFQREVNAEAKRQRKLLEEYRASRKRVFGERSYYFGSGYSAESDTGANDRGAVGVDLLVEEHENLWKRFEALCAHMGGRDKLKCEDIPWLPEELSMVEYLKAMGRVLAKQGDGSTEPLRKAYTSMCLRWHPDKFQHRYGTIFDKDEWSMALERVHKASQECNSAWEALQ